MFKEIITGIGQVTNMAGRVVIGAAMTALIAVVGGAAIVYEGVSFGVNYTAELAAKARLAIIEHSYKREAKSSFLLSAQKSGILSSEKPLTKYQDCLVSAATDNYTTALMPFRVGEHVQISMLGKSVVAKFKTVTDFPAEHGEVISKLGKVYIRAASAGYKNIEICSRVIDPTVDQPLVSFRLKNMAEAMWVKSHFDTSTAYTILPNFELSGTALNKDSYAQKFIPQFIAIGINQDRLDRLVSDLRVIEWYREADQPIGEFKYSTQIKHFRLTPGYLNLSSDERSSVENLLNMNTKLPKHELDHLVEELAYSIK